MAARFTPLDQSDPAEIAGYALRARLGSGGMGNVYLSFTRGGRPVALKVVRKEFADDPEFRRRFRQEVAAAQRVQGLYTAPVVDADPDAPVPWLATAYIAGPALNHAVAEYGPLPELSVLRLLGGVAEGLGAVHAAGLVHRDLKPANVLLAADGPRVIDFGIAHAADATALTGTGAVLGTPAFMAPEQVAGRPVSSATDVFALGHLVAYAATGHSAFGDGHFSSLVYRIVQEQPDLSGCPDGLREPTVGQWCMAKDPARSGRTWRRSWCSPRTASPGRRCNWPTRPGCFGPGGRASLAGYDAHERRAAGQRRGWPRSGHRHGRVGELGPVSAAATTVPGASGPGGFGLPPTTPQSSGPVPPRRRRGLKRPGVIPAKAVLVVLLAAVGGGAYLGFDLKGNNSPQVSAKTTTPTAKASLPSSASAAPARRRRRRPRWCRHAGCPSSASAPGAVPSAPHCRGNARCSSTEYSTPNPFPLCDPNGGQWLLVNMTPQSGGCVPNMQADANNSGYMFGTVTSFPQGLPPEQRQQHRHRERADQLPWRPRRAWEQPRAARRAATSACCATTGSGTSTASSTSGLRAWSSASSCLPAPTRTAAARPTTYRSRSGRTAARWA